jgi:hypothetical protein
MKRTRLLTIAALLVALAVSNKMQAQPMNVTFRLTFTEQGDPAQSGAVTIEKGVKGRLATKDILGVIAKASATNFPSGAKLVLEGGAFTVRVGAEVLVDNLTGILSLNQESSDRLRQGSSHSDTGAERMTETYSVLINYNDGTNTFDLTGLATEIVSVSKANRNGIRNMTDSIAINGSGSGVIANRFAIVIGGINASGKRTQ